MTYLTEKKGETALVKKIDAEVKKARAHEEWKVEYMTLQMKFHDIYDDAWDEGHGVGYNEGHEAGWDKGLKDGLFSLVEKKLISLEVAAQEAHMTEEEFLVQMQTRKT